MCPFMLFFPRCLRILALFFSPDRWRYGGDIIIIIGFS